MRAYEFIREEITAPRITAPWIVPDEPQDSKDMSVDELKAEIEKLERLQKYITPIDQEVDGINSDKITQRISPQGLERRNQGLPPNTNIHKMPWTVPLNVKPDTEIET